MNGTCVTGMLAMLNFGHCRMGMSDPGSERVSGADWSARG